MTSFLFITQIVLAILITILVLLQKSSSIGLGAYSGSNESVFGAKGPAGFLTKATFILGFLFVINTIALGYFYSQENSKSAVDTVKDKLPVPKAMPTNSVVPEASKAKDVNTTNLTTSNSSSNLKSASTTEVNKTDNKAKKLETETKKVVTPSDNANNTSTITNESNTTSSATKLNSTVNVKSSEDKNSSEAKKDEANSETNKTTNSPKVDTNTKEANNIDEASKKLENTISQVLKTENIEFETDSSTLTPKSIDTIKKIANILKDAPDAKLEIGGHTDSQGKAEYNKKLSQQRVDAVKKALVEFGINAQNLKAVGYGASKPLVDNKTAENRAKNRRVEFKIIK